MTLTGRIIAALVACLVVGAALFYVQGLRNQLVTKKRDLAEASAALTAASKALGKAASQAQDAQAQLSHQYAKEAQYEKDRQLLVAERDRALSWRVRLPVPKSAGSSDGAEGRGSAVSCPHESGADRPDPADARGLEAVLDRTYRASIGIAAEAEQCAADLAGLQSYVRDHLRTHGLDLALPNVTE